MWHNTDSSRELHPLVHETWKKVVSSLLVSSTAAAEHESMSRRRLGTRVWGMIICACRHLPGGVTRSVEHPILNGRRRERVGACQLFKEEMTTVAQNLAVVVLCRRMASLD
jgi:hypothetical protein